jgi:hypothetical protein
MAKFAPGQQGPTCARRLGGHIPCEPDRPHPSTSSTLRTATPVIRVCVYRRGHVDQGRRHHPTGSQAASYVEGANVCHRSPSDGDNRSSTVHRMQPLPTGERINVGNKPHADTHDRCTEGAALVETTSPALPTHSVCDVLRNNAMSAICYSTQRDVCVSLRNVMAALRSAWRFDIMAEWWQQH